MTGHDILGFQICLRAGGLAPAGPHEPEGRWIYGVDLDISERKRIEEDLAAADLSAIRRANMKIGVSTHSHEELDRALAAEADYVALGPIYATTLKAMPWPPQGLPRSVSEAHV